MIHGEDSISGPYTSRVVSIITIFYWLVGKSVTMVFKTKPQILLLFALKQKSVEPSFCPGNCPQQQVVRILRFFML